jgi:small basic protein
MIKVSVEEFFINLRNKENLKRYRYVFMGMKVELYVVMGSGIFFFGRRIFNTSSINIREFFKNR